MFFLWAAPLTARVCVCACSSFLAAESRMHTKASNTDMKKEALSYDIDGFSQYLAQVKAIPTLLFWKDVEDYTTLFGVQERSETAKKIFERYLKKGAEYEVASRSDDTMNAIAKELDNLQIQQK